MTEDLFKLTKAQTTQLELHLGDFREGTRASRKKLVADMASEICESTDDEVVVQKWKKVDMLPENS